MMYSDGSSEDFDTDDYADYIGEHVEPWTYLKFPYAKQKGPFALEDNAPSLYRVNSLARINVADYITTPLAQKELEEFRASFGRPAQLTLLYHWARLIELLHNAELTVELLRDPEITNRETRATVTPRAARGIGVVEAPRGTLIHDYTTDEDGLLTHVNLLVATCQNNSAINLSVKQAAQTLIKNGQYDQGTLNTVEMAIRAYDPCLSCATHRLDGRLPVKIDVVDLEGNHIDTLVN
jgi:F420-non-reducing hydrogenase large subunit